MDIFSINLNIFSYFETSFQETFHLFPWQNFFVYYKQRQSCIIFSFTSFYSSLLAVCVSKESIENTPL